MLDVELGICLLLVTHHVVPQASIVDSKKTIWVILINNYILHWMQNASFVMGFMVLDSSRRDTVSQHGKGRNNSVTRLSYSANHNALDSWPIRARLTSQNDELCKNWHVSERLGIEEQQ